MSSFIDLFESGPLHIVVYGRENERERKLADQAAGMYGVLWDFAENFLRRKVAHGEHDYTDADAALRGVWVELHGLMHEHGVTLEDYL